MVSGMKNKFIFCALFLSFLLWGGCRQEKEKPQEYSPAEVAEAQEVLQHRAEKDSLFSHAEWSPLLPADKKNFHGLKYFPVNPDYRFEGPIVKYDSVIRDTIVGTKGDLRPALKYGYFSFKYKGKPHRLQIYKILRDDPELAKYLFLGFTDQTTGKATYGAGRYIDLSENEENHYVIDFNEAYNPYCAYNPRYTCAIPPEENALPFRVEAGEKIYKSHK